MILNLETNMFKNLKSNIQNKVAKAAGSQKVNETMNVVDQQIEKNLGVIKKTINEKCPNLLVDLAKNDSNIENAVEFLHGALPFPLRLAVPEEKLLKFILNNRDKLLSHD